MRYQFTQVKITIASAWSTLQICDRQARKDCTKVTQATYTVYLALTSTQAKQTYRTIWSALQVVVAVAWWLVLLVSEIPDRHLRTEPIALLPAADEEVEEVSPIQHTVVPFKRPAPKVKTIEDLTRAELLELAQQRGLPNYRKMSTDRLRRKLAA